MFSVDSKCKFELSPFSHTFVDFENVVTLQSTSVEDEEDKWYPPTELYVEEETSQSFSVISEGETTMSSFSINEGEITDSFSFIESREVTLNQYHFDDEISLESMSISNELTDGESENTESEEECDKWSFIEEEGIETGKDSYVSFVFQLLL